MKRVSPYWPRWHTVGVVHRVIGRVRSPEDEREPVTCPECGAGANSRVWIEIAGSLDVASEYYCVVCQRKFQQLPSRSTLATGVDAQSN